MTDSDPWPPYDYGEELRARRRRLTDLRNQSGLALMRWKGKLPAERWALAKAFYRDNPHSFIRHWGVTYEPRNMGDAPALLPFVPFKRQRQLTGFVYACMAAQESGLVEKSRDMGATWGCVHVSTHLFIFTDKAIGWGSRKSTLVDQIGDPDSIFEKIRIQLRSLPPELLPEGFSFDEHCNLMRILNPETGASVTGEGGDDIGRGGRKSIYFVDEAAHLEHPESIEASLNSNTEVRIDISSVGAPGNVFHRRREAGVEWDPDVGIVKGRTNVFVMDWRHHPGKTQTWYDTKRQKAEDEGLLHVHAQEIDRDYAASITGTVIPAPWVRSAIDAHVKLALRGDGGWCGGLDVADEGDDRNALALRRGVVLRFLQEWGERDTGRTARRAVDACSGLGSLHLQYDCIGVGSGVKAETNRLKDENLMPRGLRLVPWNAGASPQWPKRRVVPDDRDSPLNEEFFFNLKAQGWWALRHRFEMTHRLINLLEKGRLLTSENMSVQDLITLAIRTYRPEDIDSFKWSEDDLISIDSTLPSVWKLVSELSQPTVIKNTRMKLVIDKRPEGMRSPNLADAVMMAYYPVNATGFHITDETLLRARERTPPPPPIFARKPSAARKPSTSSEPQSRSNPNSASEPSIESTPRTASEPSPSSNPALYSEPITGSNPTLHSAPSLHRNPRPLSAPQHRETQLRSTRPPVAPVQKIVD